MNCKLPKDYWKNQSHWEPLSFEDHDPTKPDSDETTAVEYNWLECGWCKCKLSK